MASSPFRRLAIVLMLIAAAVLPAAGANIAAGSIMARSVPAEPRRRSTGLPGPTLGNDGLLIEIIDPGPHQLVLSMSGYRTAPVLDRIRPAERDPRNAIREPDSRKPGAVGHIRLRCSRWPRDRSGGNRQGYLPTAIILIA